MDGLLLIDKPKGWTSFDVVAKIRGILRQSRSPIVEQSNSRRQSDYKAPIPKAKVGHTGTLDPMATGLLVLVIGGYCKRAAEFSKLDKTYEVTMRLGETSTTGDAEGEKEATSNKEPGIREIETAIMAFVGHIEQVPPAYSAIKIDGQRAYKLARAGKEVKLEPRKVTIYGIKLTKYHYPEVTFTAHVSSGTYIRSLVEDIGQKLATGAYMSDLRRTQVGNFNITQALAVAELAAETIYGNLLASP